MHIYTSVLVSRGLIVADSPLTAKIGSLENFPTNNICTGSDIWSTIRGEGPW